MGDAAQPAIAPRIEKRRVAAWREADRGKEGAVDGRGRTMERRMEKRVITPPEITPHRRGAHLIRRLAVRPPRKAEGRREAMERGKTRDAGSSVERAKAVDAVRRIAPEKMKISRPRSEARRVAVGVTVSSTSALLVRSATPWVTAGTPCL